MSFSFSILYLVLPLYIFFHILLFVFAAVLELFLCNAWMPNPNCVRSHTVYHPTCTSSKSLELFLGGSLPSRRALLNLPSAAAPRSVQATSGEHTITRIAGKLPLHDTSRYVVTTLHTTKVRFCSSVTNSTYRNYNQLKSPRHGNDARLAARLEYTTRSMWN